MLTLDEIAIKHNTDKSSLCHNYTVKYDKILSPHRFTYNKILEIGVHEGASLRMWKEYFSNAQITGVDYQSKSISEDRIQVVLGDQGKKHDLQEISKLGKFDLIIDDGSHRYSHQILTFEVLFDAVKSGGIYIVEDVCTSYWHDYGCGNELTTIDYFKKLIDEVNFNGIRVNKLVDRRESLLIPNYISNFKASIESIHFLNSTIIIHKR